MGRSTAPDVEFFAEITKVDEEHRTVYGYASTDCRDRQGEIVTKEAIRKALPDYMLWKNVREMHQPSAVGTAIEAQMDGKGLWFGAHVADDRAWAKCKPAKPGMEPVYKGFSIGGRVTERDALDKTVVTGVMITEISLVDRPANPQAVFELVKRSGDHLLMQPKQYWGCGNKDCQHESKLAAQECMADTAEKFAKSYEMSPEGLIKFNPHHGEGGRFAAADEGKPGAKYHVGFKHSGMDMVHMAAANTADEALKSYKDTFGEETDEHSDAQVIADNHPTHTYEKMLITKTELVEMAKFNGNHGDRGRFSSGTSMGASIDNAHAAMSHASNHEAHAQAHEESAKSPGADAKHHLAVAGAHHQAASLLRAAAKQYQTSNALGGDTFMRQGLDKGRDAHAASAAVMGKADLADLSPAEFEAQLLPFTKRDFSQKQRDEAVSSGAAMPGGGFPIENTGDLKNAITASGRAKDPEAAKAHIIDRAKVLGAEAMLPESWFVKSEATDDLGKSTPRQIQGGQFSGHLKSAGEAAAMADQHDKEALRYGKLASKHRVLANESGMVKNAAGQSAHLALAGSHEMLAARHIMAAKRYRTLAGKHNAWVQKALEPGAGDSPEIASAKQSLAGKLTKFNQNHGAHGLFASAEGTATPGDKSTAGQAPGGARALHQIAKEIAGDWKNVNFGAKPYLDAMRSLGDVSDNYHSDTGRSVVAYFLSNASSWRGDTAKRVKAELKGMLKKGMSDLLIEAADRLTAHA